MEDPTLKDLSHNFSLVGTKVKDVVKSESKVVNQ